MRVFFDNVDFSSTSGPNSFGMKLAKALSNMGHVIVDKHELPDVQISFIQATQVIQNVPIVQRLDGIWFNSAQDWKTMNKPIFETYKQAKSVIVQSDFDARLIKKFFGSHADMNVIRNGVDVNEIMNVDPLMIESLRTAEKVWTCASSWRPHKRLAENIRYFLEHAGQNDCLIIAGENIDVMVPDRRIFWTGKLDYQTLLSLYRVTDYFVHLAWLDHCPNVVVDARAAGAHIICSSSGGTAEIAGENSTIIEEDEWNFEPCELYSPPALDFSRKRQNKFNNDIDINIIAAQYETVLKRAGAK